MFIDKGKNGVGTEFVVIYNKNVLILLMLFRMVLFKKFGLTPRLSGGTQESHLFLVIF